MVGGSLYQAFTMVCRDNGIVWATATLDLKVLDVIQKAFSAPFIPFEGVEPRSYLDSPASLPVYSQVAEYEERLRETDQATLKFLFEGQGLEAVVSAPEWSLDRVGLQQDLV